MPVSPSSPLTYTLSPLPSPSPLPPTNTLSFPPSHKATGPNRTLCNARQFPNHHPFRQRHSLQNFARRDRIADFERDRQGELSGGYEDLLVPCCKSFPPVYPLPIGNWLFSFPVVVSFLKMWISFGWALSM